MADPFILYNILFYHQKRNFLSVEIAGVAYLKYFLTISSNYQNFLDSLIFFKWKKKKKLLSENSSFFPRPIILQSSNFVSRNSCPPGRASGWRHYDFNYRGNRTPVRKTFFLFFFFPCRNRPVNIDRRKISGIPRNLERAWNFGHGDLFKNWSRNVIRRISLMIGAIPLALLSKCNWRGEWGGSWNWNRPRMKLTVSHSTSIWTHRNSEMGLRLVNWSNTVKNI